MRVGLPTLAAASPRGAVVYARANRLPAIVLLFTLAVLVMAARQKQAPNARQAGALIVAAVVLVLMAEVLPDVVVAFLAALLIVQAIESADIVTAALNKLLALLPAGVGASIPQHFRPTI